MKLGINRFNYLPIIIVIIYSLFTIYLYEFGVIEFKGHDKIFLYSFLFFAHVGIIAGYWLGMHSKKQTIHANAVDGKDFILELYNICFIVYLITVIPNFMVETHTFSFSISSIISKIQLGLTDSSILYNDNRNVANVSGVWKIINIGLVFTGFIRWAFFPLSVYLWQYLKLYHKVFFFIFAFIYLTGYLVTGTTAGIFNISFIVVLPFIMKLSRQKYCNELKLGKKVISKKIKILRFIALLGALSASLWLFSNNMESRMGWYQITGDWSRFPWSIIPSQFKAGIYWLTGYVAQGYSALSYCIDLPFSPTFGLGGSWFLISNFSSLLNIDILQYTFLGKAEAFGFGAYHNWHTVYVWLANDFSFIGVPFVLLVLFYLMAQSWRDYLTLNDPFSFIFMTIMSYFCLFISANNAVFSHSDTLFAFWIVLFMWKKYKGKFFYLID